MLRATMDHIELDGEIIADFRPAVMGFKREEVREEIDMGSYVWGQYENNEIVDKCELNKAENDRDEAQTAVENLKDTLREVLEFIDKIKPHDDITEEEIQAEYKSVSEAISNN